IQHVGSLILVWTCIFFVFLLIRIQRPKNFPPGPPPLPLFGNLLHVNMANPLKDFERFAEQYGNIFSLYTGSRPAVFLNSFEVIKEALVTKAQDFSGRPLDFMINHLSENKGNSYYKLSYQLSNQISLDHRRFALMTLRNFGLGKQSMEERILEEISHLVSDLDRNAGTVNPQNMFHNVASNVIGLVLFRSQQHIPSEVHQDHYRDFKDHQWTMEYEVKKYCVSGEPRDLIDCYLDELDKRKNDGSTFSEDQLIIDILGLHFAGTDTTSNTLLTAFLYLMAHPEIQAKCQKEIDEVLEGKDHASYEDRHNMPYTLAVIHEVQHTTLMGYRTVIITNLTIILKEEGQWKFPHEFNPDNFLNEQGQFEKPEAFIPFSTGPRVCLGEGLARMELFLVIATLLPHFQFVWPNDAGDPDYTPVYGVTLTPKPYRMHIRRRETVKQ
uniref:Cytochrome P450, family 2, subfamily X, polypeptide 9 n=1 Tax=Sinocyclocheilus grahami TaxID=75366 RepID=A0A672SLR2_SINGR